MSKIERGNQPGKFSEIELRAKVRESQAFYATPEGRKAKLEAEKRKLNATAKAGTSSSLAKRSASLAEVADAKARFGIC